MKTGFFHVSVSRALTCRLLLSKIFYKTGSSLILNAVRLLMDKIRVFRNPDRIFQGRGPMSPRLSNSNPALTLSP